jgi:FkbM family methyltransferase
MNVFDRLSLAVRSNPLLGRAAISAIPSLPWKVEVRGIGAMSINLRRNRSYWLRDPLTHETVMLGALRRLITPGDVVFDVGANIGMYVRFMIRQFGAGKVVAFEPTTQNQALLKQNIWLGNCQDRVQVMRIALADYDGVDEFQVDDVSSASGCLNVVTHGKACEGHRQYGLPPATETVTVARLDTLMDNGALPIPQVIKIDVEGAEARLLQGARKLLDRHSPRLAIENHGEDTSRTVVRFLRETGYHVFGYLDTHKGRSYQEILAADVDDIQSLYSLHHCIASRDREILTAPLDLKF